MDADGIIVEGHLVALSHTFKICNDILFIMEILSGEKVNHILVRRDKQLPWHKQLDMRSKYRITHLKPDILYKGKHNIPIFHTTRKSNLASMETEEAPKCLNLLNDHSLISYQGLVTALLDEDLGIYQLDGRIHFIVSYIQDVTGEIWNMPEDSQNHELYCDTVSKKRAYKCLQVGDKVMIFHAHFVKNNGVPNLLCCGRSIVMKTRLSLLNATGLRSPNATLDALHYYNFGANGLNWLAEVRDHLLYSLCPNIVKEADILSRRQNGSRSLLTVLLRFAADRQLLSNNSRSLTLEFLSKNHQCVLNKVFEDPFTLMSVGDLPSSIVSDECDDKEKQKLWTYTISHPDQSRAIVGLLYLGENGVFRLRDQHGQIDLLIVGSKEDLLEKIGAVVVLFNAQYVQEVFNIIEEGSVENYIKKYLIVSSLDTLVLRNPDRYELMDTNEERIYNMKIISKSNLICNQQNRKLMKEINTVDMFFMAQAVILKVNEKNLQEERWKTFVKFQGHSALYHPCIEDGVSYKVKIPEMSADMKMRKQYSNAWLQPLKSYFGTCESIYLPEEALFLGAMQGQKRLNEISVCRVLQDPFQECGPISVIGVVKDRQHMTPKFPSELKSTSVDLSSQYHVGVPGNKVIRILLCDCDNPDEEIWLYLSSTSNYHIPHYTLGIVPGVTIIVSCVLRNVSKQNKKIYLQSTVFTCFTPISKVIQDSSVYLPSVHKPKLRYLKDMLGHQGTSFQTFATIGRIFKVSFSCVCSFCSSEMVGGCCTYVGCHAQGLAKMVASAQVVIDDGTGTAMLFISSSDHIKILLRLTTGQYSLLSQEIVSGSYNLSYTPRSKDGDSIDGSHYSESGLAKALETFCSRSQLLRPVNLLCRMFKNQQRREGHDGDRIHLYCLAISEIRPNLDYEDVLPVTM